MRNILLWKNLVILVAAVLTLSGFQTNAEASDYYLGVYNSGQVAYLDTSSIRIENHYVQGYHEGDTYSCTVKAVWPDSDEYEKIHYEIYVGQTESITKNGEQVWQTIRAKDPNYLEKNPVEASLLRYFYKKHESDWKNTPDRIR